MIRVFPVAREGHVHYSDDFGTPSRTGPAKHRGIDIFADEGTPVVAVDDGALRFAEEGTGGNAVYLAADDGTTYYGAHLSAFEGEGPRRAVAGEIIGYVGHTGNAAQTSSHLHFEVHPNGGPGVVDPFQLLKPLDPPSVVSSLGATDQVLPAPPAAHEAPLPPLQAGLPVPPIPHAPKRSGGAVVAVFAAALFGAATLARRRRAA